MADNEKPGWIYVLDDQLGHYKIGKTRHLSERINQLKIQLPYKVKLVAVVQTSDHDASERFLHLWLREFRVNGEWFAMQEEGLRCLWSGLYEIDYSFASRCIFVEEDGKLLNYGWWATANCMESSPTALFHHFKNLCIDQACDDFNLPHDLSTAQMLAPTLTM